MFKKQQANPFEANPFDADDQDDSPVNPFADDYEPVKSKPVNQANKSSNQSSNHQSKHVSTAPNFDESEEEEDAFVPSGALSMFARAVPTQNESPVKKSNHTKHVRQASNPFGGDDDDDEPPSPVKPAKQPVKQVTVQPVAQAIKQPVKPVIKPSNKVESNPFDLSDDDEPAPPRKLSNQTTKQPNNHSVKHANNRSNDQAVNPFLNESEDDEPPKQLIKPAPIIKQPVKQPVQPRKQSIELQPRTQSDKQTNNASNNHPVDPFARVPPKVEIDDDRCDDEEDDDDEPVQQPIKQSANPSHNQRPVSQSLKEIVNQASKIPLSTFNRSFDCQSFIADLTHPMFETIQQSNKQPSNQSEPFDPQPMTDLIDAALKRVTSLRSDVERGINHSVNHTQRAEQAHHQTINQFKINLSIIQSKFDRLDQRVSTVTSTAVRIGSKLQSINQSKLNGIKTIELINQYLLFASGDEEQVGLFNQSITQSINSKELHSLIHSAELIQTLSTIVHDLGNQSGGMPNGQTNNQPVNQSNAARLIEQTSQLIQSKLVDRFSQSMKHLTIDSCTNQSILESISQPINPKLLDEIRPVAKALIGFPGRQLIDCLIDHSMINLAMLIDRPMEDMEDDADFKLLSDSSVGQTGAASELYSSSNQSINQSVNQFRSSLLHSFASILTMVRYQCSVLPQIFNQSVNQSILIIRSIIDKIFADRITPLIQMEIQSINQAFNQSIQSEHQINNLSSSQNGNVNQSNHLSSTHSVHHFDSQELELITIAVSYRLTNQLVSQLDRLIRSLSGSSAHDSQSLIDHQSNSFVVYQSVYPAKESAFLSSKCRFIIHQTINNSANQADHHDTPGLFRKKQPNQAIKQTINQLLTGDTVDECLKYLTHSMARFECLSDCWMDRSNDQPTDQSAQLFGSCFSVVCEDLMLYCLSELPAFLPTEQSIVQSINQSIDQSNQSTEQAIAIDPFYISCLGRMPGLVERFTSILQHDNDSIHQSIPQPTNQQILNSIEHQIATALSKFIESLIAALTKQLSNQKSTDYKPKEESWLSGQLQSSTCTSVCALVTAASDSLLAHFDGRNLDKMLAVFGSRAVHAIQQHLFKQSVSPMGAALLWNDLKLYEETIVQLHVTHVSEQVGQMRHMGAMYFVSIEHLSAFLNEQRCVKMDREQLVNYCKMRSDWGQNKTKITAMVQQLPKV